MALFNEEAALDCVALAEGAKEAGEEERARRLAEKALRMCPSLLAAQRLLQHLDKWGKDSEAAHAVREAMGSDYYTLLGVERGMIDENQVKKAYRTLSRKLHPVS